jgi:hypothetical protein
MSASLTRCIFEKFLHIPYCRPICREDKSTAQTRNCSDLFLVCYVPFRNESEIFLGKPEGKNPIGRPGRRWEDNIKINRKETGGAAVAQAEKCLTTGWTIGVRSPTGAEEFSSSSCAQTGSEADPASYPMGTGGPFPGGKARGRGVTLTTHPHLVPRLSMSRTYTSSSPPMCLHGV